MANVTPAYLGQYLKKFMSLMGIYDLELPELHNAIQNFGWKKIDNRRYNKWELESLISNPQQIGTIKNYILAKRGNANYSSPVTPVKATAVRQPQVPPQNRPVRPSLPPEPKTKPAPTSYYDPDDLKIPGEDMEIVSKELLRQDGIFEGAYADKEQIINDFSGPIYKFLEMIDLYKLKKCEWFFNELVEKMGIENLSLIQKESAMTNDAGEQSVVIRDMGDRWNGFPWLNETLNKMFAVRIVCGDGRKADMRRELLYDNVEKKIVNGTSYMSILRFGEHFLVRTIGKNYFVLDKTFTQCCEQGYNYAYVLSNDYILVSMGYDATTRRYTDAMVIDSDGSNVLDVWFDKAVPLKGAAYMFLTSGDEEVCLYFDTKDSMLKYCQNGAPAYEYMR